MPFTLISLPSQIQRQSLKAQVLSNSKSKRRWPNMIIPWYQKQGETRNITYQEGSSKTVELGELQRKKSINRRRKAAAKWGETWFRQSQFSYLNYCDRYYRTFVSCLVIHHPSIVAFFNHASFHSVSDDDSFLTSSFVCICVVYCTKRSCCPHHTVDV